MGYKQAQVFWYTKMEMNLPLVTSSSCFSHAPFVASHALFLIQLLQGSLIQAPFLVP